MFLLGFAPRSFELHGLSVLLREVPAASVYGLWLRAFSLLHALLASGMPAELLHMPVPGVGHPAMSIPVLNLYYKSIKPTSSRKHRSQL